MLPLLYPIFWAKLSAATTNRVGQGGPIAEARAGRAGTPEADLAVVPHGGDGDEGATVSHARDCGSSTSLLSGRVIG